MALASSGIHHAWLRSRGAQGPLSMCLHAPSAGGQVTPWFWHGPVTPPRAVPVAARSHADCPVMRCLSPHTIHVAPVE
eukprot:13297706-Alexandrium_andersonii.AAC.1